MRVVFKLGLGIAPLLLTGLFGWLVAESYLNLGGGEKEIVLVIPLGVWSLAFLCCYLVLWWRGSATARSVAAASGVATALLLAAGVALFGVSGLRLR